MPMALQLTCRETGTEREKGNAYLSSFLCHYMTINRAIATALREMTGNNDGWDKRSKENQGVFVTNHVDIVV